MNLIQLNYGVEEEKELALKDLKKIMGFTLTSYVMRALARIEITKQRRMVEVDSRAISRIESLI